MEESILKITMKKMKIMFVCMGNICRSPLAHGIFQKMVVMEGLEEHFEIESSGTTGYHAGDLPDHRMSKTAYAHGYNLDHRARRFMPHDLESYDLILAMDKDNLADIRSHIEAEGSHAEVKLFRDFDPEGYEGSEVPDPYYGGDEGFENVFRIVERSCKNLLNQCKKDMQLT